MRVSLVLMMTIAAVPMQAQSPSSRPKPVALLAEEVEIYFGPGGREQGRVEKRIAIRSDGARAELRRSAGIGGDGQVSYTRLIVDPFRARRLAVHGPARAITISPLGWQEVNALRAEARDPYCGITPDRAQPVTILGFPALRGSLVGASSGRSGLTRQVVRSPELGCLELRSIAAMPNPDGTQSVTIREVRSIELREPPPELFEPPDWPELSAAELERRSRQQP